MSRLLERLDDDSQPAPDLGAWLDRVIMSPDLHEVVAELAVVRTLSPRGVVASPDGSTDPHETPADRAADWLGDAADDVLEHGLAALPDARLTELLQAPQLLFDLQELVLTEGAAHWLGLLAIHAPKPLPAGLLERLQAIDRPQPL